MNTKTLVSQTEPLLIRVEEAAKLLGICRWSAFALIRRGELPIVKIGASTRVPRAAVHDFIARRAAVRQAETEGGVRG